MATIVFDDGERFFVFYIIKFSNLTCIRLLVWFVELNTGRCKIVWRAAEYGTSKNVVFIISSRFLF